MRSAPPSGARAAGPKHCPSLHPCDVHTDNDPLDAVVRPAATLPPVRPFVATLAAALVAGLLAREALGLPLVAAMAIALVAGLAADYTARRNASR